MSAPRLLRRAVAVIPAVVVVALFCAGVSHAQPTLTSITIDGSMADWSAVLGNPANVILDGPAGGLPDADSPVPNDRDLLRAAFTWDSSYLYFHVQRESGSNQGRRFWFYLDINNDGIMTTGEPVLHLFWTALFGITVTYLDTYQASAGGGDPVQGGGGHDGYTLPGDRSGGPLLDLAAGGGNGLEVETRVPWASLGLSPGSPIQFHISTSSGTGGFPNNIQDNMGGAIPSLMPVVTLVKAVDKTSAAPSEVLTYMVTYNNTGIADALSVQILDPVPANTTYIAGSASGAGMTIDYSHDGGFNFDGSQAAPVTHVRWTLGGALVPGAGGVVVYQVTID